MCIIIYKPANKELPARDILETCELNNPDGAGYMIHKDGLVQFKKGFMDFNEFWESIQGEGDLTQYHVGIHFRIATHGTICSSMCHPFPIVHNKKELIKTSGITKYCAMHNGTIPNFGESMSYYSYYTKKTKKKKTDISLSDTAEFIKDCLTLLKDKLHLKRCQKLVSKLIDGSRMLIFTPNKIILLGNWIKDNGIYYSNSSYKTIKTYKTYSYNNLSCTGKTGFFKCGYCGEIFEIYERRDFAGLALCEDCYQLVKG